MIEAPGGISGAPMTASAPGVIVDAGRILKVNHAGEHGAVSIYAGQIYIARLLARDLLPQLETCKAHEETHRAIFAKELLRRGLPRCRSYWLCAVGGYALGIISALLGVQAIAATTVAVERVVLRHLQHQLALIGESDPQALAAISAIMVDEQQHHDHFAAVLKPERSLNRLLGAVVAASTELVIWIGMRS